MTVATAEHVAIAELVIYIPIALLSIFVVFRHGFYKQLGWIYLCIFSGIRIGGSIMEILSTKNPENANDKEWATILQSVGLSPLLLSTLGLMKRIFDETSDRIPSDPLSSKNLALQAIGAVSGIFGKLLSIYSKKATAASYRSKFVQLLHIPALIALILAISGGTDQASSDESEHATGKTETRAAIILFLLIYISTCLLWVITVRDLHKMEASQKRIFVCVFLALPFIAVRLLYSLIADFGHNPRFSFVDGDIKIQIVMATVEEFAVVCLYTILGLVTPRSSINPAVGGGIVPAAAYPLGPGEAVSESLAYNSQPAYTSVPYAEAGAQYAYNQKYGRGN
ncbi:hypothetical protein PoHVEF18_010241 [Penicillium ochrochloron]